VRDYAPQRSRRTRVAELDRLLQREPDAIEARYERAGLLRELGAYEDAKRDYLELIRRKPDDFGVLNDFGTLVLDAGYGSAARSLFEEAVRRHPDNPMGRVNLANLLLMMEEYDLARVHFQAALRADPGHVHAHRGLGNVLANTGDADGARRHRDLGFCGDFVTALPYRGAAAPVRVLLLVSAMGGNTPTACLPRRFWLPITTTVKFRCRRMTLCSTASVTPMSAATVSPRLALSSRAPPGR